MRLQALFIPLCLVAGISALAIRQSSPGACEVQSKSLQPSGSICGKTGGVQSAAIISTSTVTSQTACRDLCWNKSTCLSFSYDTSNQKCTQYAKSISNQGFSQYSCTVTWWDKSCYENWCPPCATEGQTNCAGTCVSLNSDNKNCGACGAVCGSSQICSSGKCVANPASCSNQGLEWAKYPNTRSDGSNNENRDSKYSSFDPALFKNRTPVYKSITTSMGGINSGQNSYIYGSNQQSNTDYYTLNHRGYLFAPETGTYTMTISSNDDIVCIWIGSLAYSGFTRSNAKKCLAVNSGDPTSFTFDLAANTYSAMRIIFGQGQVVAAFSLSLTSPSGIVLLNSDTTGSNYIVQKSCDGQTAPAYVAFGSET